MTSHDGRRASETGSLHFAVTPLSGPTRGGTSLNVSLRQPAATASWALHLGSVALNCTAGGSSLCCCCAPAADSPGALPLVLYRSSTGSTGASATAATAAPANPYFEAPGSAFELAHSPTEFLYYVEPRLLKLSPQKGGSRGESITIVAQGWPATAPRLDVPACRFGELPPVPATSTTVSAAGTAKVVCTSPDFRDAEGSVEVSVAPNGLDFGLQGLVFHYSPQPWIVLLAAFLVLLAVLLLLRAYAGARRLLIAKGYVADAPAHWPRLVGGYVRREGYRSVSQHQPPPTAGD